MFTISKVGGGALVGVFFGGGGGGVKVGLDFR